MFQVDPVEAFKRVVSRGGGGDRALTMNYLQQVDAAHNAYVRSTGIDVLTINANGPIGLQVNEICNWIIKKVTEKNAIQKIELLYFCTLI